jgi:hypothetical protein
LTEYAARGKLRAVRCGLPRRRLGWQMTLRGFSQPFFVSQPLFWAICVPKMGYRQKFFEIENQSQFKSRR